MDSQQSGSGLLPPYSNTGVIDNPKNVRKPSVQEGFDLIIDWFSFTFSLTADNVMQELSNILPRLFPGKIEWIPEDIDWDGDTDLAHFVGEIKLERRKGGWHGYDTYQALLYGQDQIGVIAWGGKSQNGRMLISITGKGCTHLDYESAHALLLSLQSPRITRCDIALDDYAGKFSVSKCTKWDWSPKNGPTPSMEIVSKIRDGKPFIETVYIGSRKSGKHLCAYHKGIESGMPDFPWQRYELRITNDQVEIPLDVLLNPKPYFLGGYPVLYKKFKKILDCIVVNPFPSKRKSSELALAKKSENMRNIVGRFVGFLQHEGVSPEEIVAALSKPTGGVPVGLSSFGLDEALDKRFPSRRIDALAVTDSQPILTIDCKQSVSFPYGKEEIKTVENERRM